MHLEIDQLLHNLLSSSNSILPQRNTTIVPPGISKLTANRVGIADDDTAEFSFFWCALVAVLLLGDVGAIFEIKISSPLLLGFGIAGLTDKVVVGVVVGRNVVTPEWCSVGLPTRGGVVGGLTTGAVPPVAPRVRPFPLSSLPPRLREKSFMLT